MKIVILLYVTLVLTGCSPTPMSTADSSAFEACIKQGWKPEYFSNSGLTRLTCVKE